MLLKQIFRRGKSRQEQEEAKQEPQAADLLVRHVAPRVLGPGIAAHFHRAHAGVAAADVEVGAGAAAPADGARPRLQAGHHGMARVGPDGREGAQPHVAERAVPPHGVRVHVAEVVDVRDVDPGAVAAPLGQLRPQVILVQVRDMPAGPVQEIDAVGVVVAGDVVALEPAPRVVPAAREEHVHRVARGAELGVALAVHIAAPGVVEVREIEPGDALLFHQIEERLEVRGVVAGQREAHADLHLQVAQQAQRGQGLRERLFLSPEAVVRLLQPVEADADVAEARVADARGERRVDQRAVGRERDVQAQVLRARGDLEQVRAQQRLAARQDQRRHAEGLEVVHDREHLLRRQLAREIDVGRDRVAVHAGEVAAADQVPDHHRARRVAPRAGRRRPQDLVHEAGDAEHVRRASVRSSSGCGCCTGRHASARDFREAASISRIFRPVSARSLPCTIANRL